VAGGGRVHLLAEGLAVLGLIDGLAQAEVLERRPVDEQGGGQAARDPALHELQARDLIEHPIDVSLVGEAGSVYLLGLDGRLHHAVTLRGIGDL